MATSVRELFPFGDLDEGVLGEAVKHVPGSDLASLATGMRFATAAVVMLDTLPRPFAEAGLTPARWRLLVALRFQAGEEGASIGELAAHLGVREPTITASVDRAERDGHVERLQDITDRRRVRVHLTPFGEETFHTLLPVMIERIVGFVEAIGGTEVVGEMGGRLWSALSVVQQRDEDQER